MFVKWDRLILTVTVLLSSVILTHSVEVEARIRMNKVKDAPKTCKVMGEDPYLSRPYRRVWVTQRSSVVVDRENLVVLVDDLGRKICDWKSDDFEALGNLQDFRFYIDEYKEMFYPFVKREEGGFLRIDVPFKTCSLSKQQATEQVDLPKCTPPPTKKAKRSSKRRPASTKKR